jgi:hypothetical protein
VTLLNLTVQGNHGSDGGGIRVFNGGAALISATTIVSNTATWGGGVLVDLGGSATIVNSDIRGNTAEDSGGGIDAWWPGSMVDISYSTVAGNSARQGGGIQRTPWCAWPVTLFGNTAHWGSGLGLEQRAGPRSAGPTSGNTAFGAAGLHPVRLRPPGRLPRGGATWRRMQARASASGRVAVTMTAAW